MEGNILLANNVKMYLIKLLHFPIPGLLLYPAYNDVSEYHSMTFM